MASYSVRLPLWTYFGNDLTVHPCYPKWQDFLLSHSRPIFHCVNISSHNFFIHSFADGHLDCFLILVIVNNAAINIRAIYLLAVVEKPKAKCWRGCGEKGILLHCWWECKLVPSLWKKVSRFLKKIKNRNSIWSNVSTFGCIFQGNENRSLRRWWFFKPVPGESSGGVFRRWACYWNWKWIHQGFPMT